MTVWVGVAILGLTTANPRRADGFVGAYAPFACRSESFGNAVAILARELQDSNYILLGVESMIPTHILDRELSAYERALVAATEQSPVQFKNVHEYKGNA